MIAHNKYGCTALQKQNTKNPFFFLVAHTRVICARSSFTQSQSMQVLSFTRPVMSNKIFEVEAVVRQDATSACTRHLEDEAAVA